MSRRRLDLAGKKFGMLNVISYSDQRYAGSVLWNCICDCGNTFMATASAISRGKAVSCGCYRINHRERDHLDYLKRRQVIRDLVDSGQKIKDIAIDLGITRQRLYQILNGRKKS